MLLLHWLFGMLVGGSALAGVVASDRTPDRWLPLDPYLTEDERRAIAFAFHYEDNASNLRAFSAALLPDRFQSSRLLSFRAAQRSGQSVGWFLEDVGEWVEEASEDAWDMATHPADTASGAWHAITHPADSFEAFANGLVDALHLIPGMDEAGELLKDFAHTAVGEWALRVLATVGYYVMAPYLGAQLAAVSFALPGSAKAEPFLSTWITETIDRVVKTVNILLQQEGLRNVGTATSAAVNKILAENPAVQAMAKEFTAQIGKASAVLTDKLGVLVAQKIKEGASDAVDAVRRKLAEEYGMPPNFSKLAREAGIREDNAAAAYDYFAHTNYQTTTTWDAATGEDVFGHLRASRFGAVGDSSMLTQGAYQDPRLISAAGLEARRQVAVAQILQKPPRRFWIDHYATRARFAEARRLAAQNRRYLAPALGGYALAPSTTAQASAPVVDVTQPYAGGFAAGTVFRR